MQEVLRAFVEGEPFTASLAERAMEEMMRGEATPAQVGAFLTALRLRGETPEVVAACARVMRAHAEAIPVNGTVDVVGTGGDGAAVFNVSTAAAIVLAAAGARVAKHGNRAMSSRCGSADILEALGARIDLGPDAVARLLEECGFCFVFAQRFHPAMRHVAGPRRELGFRTVFNVLGPLTNPARPRAQLTGVGARPLAPLVAEALAVNGIERAIVVHSEDGLDEVSPSAPTRCWLVENGRVTEFEVAPESFGLPAHPLAAVKGGDAAENAATLRALVAGEANEAVRDFVVMNAAMAAYAAGMVGDLRAGADLAREALASGAARRVLETYVRRSRELADG
jgi:anthranilate phosphoribosyltransferase